MKPSSTARAAVEAFKVTIPVLFGYLAIGIAFGIMLETSGYPWYLAAIMSIFIYAGALEYMAVSFLVSSTPMVEIAIMSFLVNFRHIVYGLSLFNQVNRARRFKPYVIFALTDETYALLTTIHYPPRINREKYTFFIALFDHCYWVIGSVLGALAGSLIPFDSKGIDFALTALFIVLLIEQWKNSDSKLPFAIALIAGVAAMVIDKSNMLLIAVLLASAALLLLRRRIEHANVHD